MGGCIGGDRLADTLGGQAGEAHLRRSPSPSPLSLRVVFHTDHHPDAEARVVRSLADLLWIDSASDARLATATCIASLNAAKAAQSEILLDFAVPVVNAMLHAAHAGVRQTLWEGFVLAAVRDDIAVAHLFYWALKCVITSPQADAKTKLDAERKLQEVTLTMAAQAQVATAMSRIQAANEALKRRQPLPHVPEGALGATPLVDLLDRLHTIGEDIVKVRDKKARQQDLSRRIQEQVNEHMVDAVPVPVQMLTPNAANAPDPHTGAALLRLPAAEARVLSSKERAPYLVVVELEQLAAERRGATPGLPGSARRLWGACPCRAARAKPQPPPKRHSNGLPLAAVSSRAPASSPTSTNDASPLLGTWSSVTSPATLASSAHSEGHEEGIAQYLREQDQRPRGAFNKESWDQVVERVRSSSEFGQRPNWSLLSLIVKSNADDVRQEELAYRLLKWFQRVFRRHKLKLWLHPFLIVATRHDGGCLETVTNAISLSDLKKSYGTRWHSLRSYFEQTFQVNGDAVDSLPAQSDGGKTPRLVPKEKALMNFIWSMASYSIVCYVLAIRDRHNGNILIDDEGHILHVDFGFMLCGAPGGKALQKMGGFEHSDGFKLTKEFVDVLGPTDHRPFQVFRQAVLDGLLAVRRHADELLALLQLSMLGSENHEMNCFRHPSGRPESVLEDICDRLGLPGLAGQESSAKSDEEFLVCMEQKVIGSVDHWRSRLYDKYQYHFTGVH